MRYPYLFTGVTLATILSTSSLIWAGPGNGSPYVRETMLPHFCQAGPHKGESCEVWEDDVCKGFTCALKYTPGASAYSATVTLMIDDDPTKSTSDGTADLITPDEKALTVLLCVEREEGSRCFTETYLADNDAIGSVKLITMPFAPLYRETSEESLISLYQTEGYGEWEPLYEWLQFLSIPPDSEVADQLRTYCETTGILIVEDPIRESLYIEDHTGDSLGTVFSFDFTLRFVVSKKTSIGDFTIQTNRTSK